MRACKSTTPCSYASRASVVSVKTRPSPFLLGRSCGRREQVARRKHKAARLVLGLFRKRHVYRHLVAVKVGVEGGTDQRVKLDSAALNQHSLEGLNAETVQRWSAVQQHRMVLDDLFQNVPDFRLDTLDEAFRALDIVREVLLDQLAHDERLEIG